MIEIGKMFLEMLGKNSGAAASVTVFLIVGMAIQIRMLFSVEFMRANLTTKKECALHQKEMDVKLLAQKNQMIEICPTRYETLAMIRAENGKGNGFGGEV